MTATVLLIRHASHAHLGTILSGRTPGIALSEAGRRQAIGLARALSVNQIDALHSSPVQRACETARAIAETRPELAVEEIRDLDEVDFGEWAGRKFAQLAADPAWHRWNEERERASPPGGESMASAQARAWRHIEQTAARLPGQTIAMVTHCDIVRAVAARVLGLSLGALLRFDVDPASVSRIALGGWGAKLLSLNERWP